MKKIALALFLLFCLYTPANAADFVEIAASEESVIYLDVDSVKERDGYIVAWTKWDYSEAIAPPGKYHNKNVMFSLKFYAYHADYRQTQYLSIVDCDKNGHTIGGHSTPFDTNRFKEVDPGSVGERIYESVMAVCQKTLQPLPKTYVSMTNLVGSSLGIAFAPQKTAEGYYLVAGVRGGVSEFAGFKVGDIFTKIDNYDLKKYDMKRVDAYISLRRKQRAIIKATVDRQGTKKVIEIQL